MSALLGAVICGLALWGLVRLLMRVKIMLDIMGDAIRSAVRRALKHHRRPDTDARALLHLALTGLIDALAAHNAKMVATSSEKSEDSTWYVDAKDESHVKQN